MGLICVLYLGKWSDDMQEEKRRRRRRTADGSPH